MADSQGTFTRMLGLDINPPGQGTPHSQRYMGLVQDGILTRIVRASHLSSCDADAVADLHYSRSKHVHLHAVCGEVTGMYRRDKFGQGIAANALLVGLENRAVS